MTNNQKVMIELNLLVDLSQTIQIFFDIVKNKHLTEEELEKIRYAAKLMETCNELFEKSINMTPNAN